MREGVLMEKRIVVNYRFLASIWTLRLFNRGCDICKEFRLEISAIHSRTQKFRVDDFKQKSREFGIG